MKDLFFDFLVFGADFRRQERDSHTPPDSIVSGGSRGRIRRLAEA
jgi:hypothetical protein